MELATATSCKGRCVLDVAALSNLPPISHLRHDGEEEKRLSLPPISREKARILHVSVKPPIPPIITNLANHKHVKEHKAEIALRWKVEGKSNRPGPVRLLTAMERAPRGPMPSANAVEDAVDA